jgi:epoxyqueuosine reductase
LSLTSHAIKAQAKAVGFDLCGVARGETVPRLARLERWIDEGMAGEMTYLASSLEERRDPSRVLPSVRSIVSLGCVYNTNDTPTHDDVPATAILSRYARGDDYHDVIRQRLRTLVTWMAGTAGPGFEAFSCVDAGPVQERVFAEQAGLGWIGKHTGVINASLGSWIFLAEVLTNAELEPDEPAVDQCGTCTRCIDACPTGAIVEPYTVDATRCLSYLTIEKRGPVPHELRDAIGAHVYGCDVCQDVCPWNRRAASSSDPAWQPRAVSRQTDLVALCRMSDDEWRAALRGSAMRRAGLRRIRRSLAYAAAHLPDADRAAALKALTGHPSAAHEDVADAISWAR